TLNPEWEEFRQHLLQCEPCSAEVSRWTKLEHLLRAVGKEAAVIHPAEELLGQFHRNPESLQPEERHAIQQHLQGCPVCREGVGLLASFDFSLIQKWEVETQPDQPPAEEKASVVSLVILQFAHKTLQLLGSHLVAPFLDVQELLIPQPAYRSEAGPLPA